MRLPLLDIRTWRTDPRRFADALRHACHKIGFFQLRHDLPPAVPAKLLLTARDFFALPDAEKRAICYSHSPAFRGYMACGMENTSGTTDLREQIELARDGPRAPARAMPPHERLRGPNQWPARVPAMRPAVDEYVGHMLGLCDELSEALCVSLDLKPGALRPLLQPAPHWQLKLAGYSPTVPAPAAGSAGSEPRRAPTATEDDCESREGSSSREGSDGSLREDGSEVDPLSLGCGAHTDSGFLTLVLQDGSSGLQAWSRGEWVDVPPAGPDVLVCNLGV